MILFDLDGTLWDSAEQVAQSWNIIFRQFEAATADSETESADTGICRIEPADKGICRIEPADKNICRTEPADKNICRTEPADKNTCRTEPADKNICETKSAENGNKASDLSANRSALQGFTDIEAILTDPSAAGIKMPVLTADDIRNVMGKTMEEISQLTMPDMEPESRRNLFKICETYEVTYIESHGGVLFPGVRETLARLKDLGHEMAIVSNCQVGYIRAFLKSMDMEQYFCDYEEWGRTGMSKGKNIRLVMDRHNCAAGIYVGDTQKDKDAADEAGIPFIWASYGFGTVDSCSFRLEQFAELLTAVRKF